MSTLRLWTMSLHDDFEAEFEELTQDIQEQLLALARAVEIAAPKAGRPHVDTLKQSKHANIKEMRFTSSDGKQVWRAAFAFDPERQGIILAAADNQGVSEKLFYKRLTDRADKRFDAHLKALAAKATGRH